MAKLSEALEEVRAEDAKKLKAEGWDVLRHTRWLPLRRRKKLDRSELADVHGSSVLIRDPGAPTFVHGNSDGDGRIEGFSPRLRITPGASNPLFSSSPPPSGTVVPEPTPAGLIALGVSVLVGSRRCTRLAVR